MLFRSVWIERAREVYGVPAQPGQDGDGAGQKQAEGESEKAEDTGIERAETTQTETMPTATKEFSDGQCRVVVTDREEIEELEALLTYIQNYYHRSVFQRRYISVTVRGEDGDEWMGYLPKGTLPEKYILRFGEW